MYGEVTCAAGCGETGPPGETMTEMLGGDYQCAECLGAVISRASMDDDAVLPDGTRAWAVRSSQRAPRRRAG